MVVNQRISGHCAVSLIMRRCPAPSAAACRPACAPASRRGSRPPRSSARHGSPHTSGPSKPPRWPLPGCCSAGWRSCAAPVLGPASPPARRCQRRHAGPPRLLALLPVLLPLLRPPAVPPSCCSSLPCPQCSRPPRGCKAGWAQLSQLAANSMQQLAKLREPAACYALLIRKVLHA